MISLGRGLQRYHTAWGGPDRAREGSERGPPGPLSGPPLQGLTKYVPALSSNQCHDMHTLSCRAVLGHHSIVGGGML